MKYSTWKAKAAERRAAMLAHYATSESYAETGRAFGITRQRVEQLVKAAQGKPAPHRKTKA